MYNSDNSALANQTRLNNFVESRLVSLYCYYVIHKRGYLDEQLRKFEEFINTPNADEISDQIRLALCAKVKKKLCELSPSGMIDDIVQVSDDRSSFYCKQLHSYCGGTYDEWNDLSEFAIGEDD